jgi:putative transposase
MRIRDVHAEPEGRYGAPRVHAELARRGHRHGRIRIARLMRARGMQGKAARRWKRTTIPDPAAPARAGLIRRDFTAGASRLNTRWCGDITYIPIGEGWLCLATVTGIASRRVTGHAMADHLRTELAAGALANALAARDPAPGVIFHADRGCQYTSAEYATLAEDHGVILSHGRPGSAGTHPSRKLLQRHQGRTPRRPCLARPHDRPPRRHRVHRLVQRHPSALRPPIRGTRRIRSRRQANDPQAVP